MSFTDDVLEINIDNDDQVEEQGFQIDSHSVRFKHKKQAVIDMNSSIVLGYEFFSEPIIDGEPIDIMTIINSITQSDEMEKFDNLIIKSLIKNYIKKLEGMKKFINISSDRILQKLDPNQFYKIDGIVIEIQSNLMKDHSEMVKNKIEELKFYNIAICIDDYQHSEESYQYIKNVKPQYLKLLREFNTQHFKPDADMEHTRKLIEEMHAVGSKVICGQVETLDELKKIESCGILGAQGYLIERPIE